MKSIIAVAVAIIAFIPAQAFAYDWAVVTKIVAIEGTYVPSSINFKVDANAGNCSAGSLITWNPAIADAPSKAQNVNAVLSMLMTASVTGHTVTIYGNNNGCSVDYIYLNS